MAMIKNGRMIPVENTQRKVLKSGHVTGAETLVAIPVEDEKGENEEWLLFTPHQIEVARKRAAKNPEDIPKKNFFEKLID